MAKIYGAIAVAVLLTACAQTLEQMAARAAEQRRYEEQLQVSLAAQCHAETAELMQQHFRREPFANEKAQQDFRVRYVERINDPMFQACYKMAWQNHISQQRLRQAEYYYHHDAFYPRYYRPFGWY